MIQLPVISIIVAASENNVIGIQNRLPWNLPADLQYFKNTTWAMPIIMGRKTFDSIGKALPGRHSIVITRSKNFQPEGVSVVHSLDEALRACQNAPREFRKDMAFIIGGGDIYKQSLALADEIFLTRIQREIEGDTFYPDPVQNGFRLVDDQASEENGYQFNFLKYLKI